MKIINVIIGIVLIFFGITIMNIHVFNEEFKSIVFKVFGFIFLTVGVFYIDKTAKFRKQHL